MKPGTFVGEKIQATNGAYIWNGSAWVWFPG